MNAVKILSVLLSVYLVGCATASGPKFSGLKNPGETEAIVYVYRVHDFDSRTSYPYFFINNEMKMPIRDKGYNLYPLMPGEYEFKVSKGDSLFWSDKDLVLTKEIMYWSTPTGHFL
ncbi:MAG: hypothetical protein MI976_03130 [Pseudomonadales bacterium]|nr:hypothetical protein [Pseudomonadales bacterium]